MELTMKHYPVQGVSWGEQTYYRDGQLIVNRIELLAELERLNLLKEVDVEDVVLISPHQPLRVVNIFDVFAARCRLDDDAVNYPGVLGPVQGVGQGRSATLDQFTVLAISQRVNRYNKMLDMAGPGSEVTPQASFHHVALVIKPKRDDMSEPDYHGWLKKIGLAAGQFLARCASEADGAIERTYTLDVPIQSDLPKVAYVCMLTSHQRSEAGEPVLYGDDLSGMLPTVLHPNEFLDGGVIAPYWTMCMDSYSFQNNPIILDLYQRHGTEVDFKGVVVCAAHITRNDRARTVQMAANLVKHVLKADSAVLTKVGGGIPESDLFNILEILEKDGVSTSAVIWSHMGDGSVADSLSVSTPAANALATTGVNDDWVTLSAQTEVIGGGVAVPYFDNAADPDALRQARQVHYREISGAISQVGISRVGFTVV